MINEEKISELKAEIVTVITRKVWNMKATSKHFMLLQSEHLTHYVKRGCLHGTIIVPQVHGNIKSKIESKVDLLFQRFLVITVLEKRTRIAGNLVNII